MSLSASAVKKSILKNQDGAAAISLTDPFRIITKYRDVSFFFKMAAVRHVGFLKLNYLTAVQFRDPFCGIVSNFYRDR